MDNVASWISAACAAISVVFTFVTVWWPWHTRRAANLECEQEVSVLRREEVGDLLIATRLRMPDMFLRVQNIGDGIAHSLHVYGGPNNECVFFRSRDDGKFLYSSRLTSLKPDEKITIIILPTTRKETCPLIKLEWKEEPTRLKLSQVSKSVDIHKTLTPKRPLTHQERVVAYHSMENQATEFATSVEVLTERYGLNFNDLDPYAETTTHKEN